MSKKMSIVKKGSKHEHQIEMGGVTLETERTPIPGKPGTGNRQVAINRNKAKEALDMATIQTDEFSRKVNKLSKARKKAKTTSSSKKGSNGRTQAPIKPKTSTWTVTYAYSAANVGLEEVDKYDRKELYGLVHGERMVTGILRERIKDMKSTIISLLFLCGILGVALILSLVL